MKNITPVGYVLAILFRHTNYSFSLNPRIDRDQKEKAIQTATNKKMKANDSGKWVTKKECTRILTQILKKVS